METPPDDKLTIKNYAGYTTVEVANSLAFAIIGIYLTVFYSDILGIPLMAISAIMVGIRIFDGVNDTIIGFWIQSRKPSKGGKFRPFLKKCSVPIGIVFFLMFVKIPNTGVVVAILFALLTYIAFSIFFTMIQVSYGSLATVMTRKEEERSLLSVCRSIGGGIGGMPAGILFPMFVFHTFINDQGEKVEVLDHNSLLIAIAIISILMAIIYTIGYYTTEETYTYPDEKQKMNIKATFKTLKKNKSFIIMSLASMLLITAQMYIGTINIYLFKDYYRQSRLLTYYTIIFYLPMAVLIPFVNKLIKNYGKKEVCIFGLVLSTVVSLFMWTIIIENPWVYIVLSFIQGLGMSFLTLEVWAMAMDVIDKQELLSKKREEASSFAIFTFMRKVGQSLAALVPTLLFVIGYNSELIGQGQTPETLSGLYTIANLIPFIIFLIMVMLMVIYPLNKQKTIEMREELEIQRKEYDVIED